MDPTALQYAKFMSDITDYAHSNPDKSILSLQMFASLGYNSNGYQCMATSNLREGQQFFELIPVEQITREKATIA